MTDSESEQFADSREDIFDISLKMESVLQPPPPFSFENNLVNVTSGNLSTEWDNWKKSFKIYYEACELSAKPKKVQVNILLHVIGTKCREVYEQFTNDDTDTVDGLLKKFDAFFVPVKNLAVERHKFFKRDQKDLESTKQYIFELNKIAAKCEFGDLRDGLLCSRFICGVREVTLSERMLREPDITLKKAMDICKLAEMSKMQALNIKTNSVEQHVHEVSQNNNQSGTTTCDVHVVNRRYASAAINRPRRPTHTPMRSNAPSGAREHQTYHNRSTFSTPNPRERTFNRYNNSSPQATSSEPQRTFNGCSNCGHAHRRMECPAFGVRCNSCNRMNHYARMCRSSRRVYEIQEDSTDQVIAQVNNVNSDWSVNLEINKGYITFKLDSGAEVNVLPKRFLSKIQLSTDDLTKTSTKLRGYSGEGITVLGKCYLKVSCKGNTHFLKFIIADVDSCPVLGRSSCVELNLVKLIMSISEHSPSEKILDEFLDIFEGMGCLPGEYKIQLKNDVSPVVHAPRKLPLALKDQIKNKLDEMEREGIISKVEGPTDWVNSMTVVKKPNGDLRLCLDPRDLNKAIRREYFKLPTFEEITAELLGAKYFSTLDAKQGFWQVKLHPSCTDLCTFNTVFGRYKFLRMPYGISSASEIFHKRLYSHFDDIEGVVLFVDDLLVYGPTKEIHDQRLRAVLNRCKDINIKLNRQKCRIGLTEIKYLGHKIGSDGIRPDDSHISAIRDMPTPQNVKDVERFLGLVTYVSNFIPNFSEKSAKLRELLRKDIEWHWDKNHEDCFKELRTCLTSSPVLQYYDINAPVVISVDASKHGLGACLLQRNLPVCYASKSLTKTEQAYAQIEKELYACVFACEKFYTYIYGRTNIIIETDHKPLVNIINKPLANAPARLQRMLMRLYPYTFTLVYKPGKYLYIADALSRAPAPNAGTPLPPLDHLEAQAQVCALAASNALTDTHLLEVQRCTKEDNELQNLIKVIKRGWPNEKDKLNDTLKCYWNIRDELTTDFGMVWKGNRIVIQKCMRHDMLKKIHSSHFGLDKCKLRARETVYWPNINSQLQDYLSNCQACLTYKKQNSKEPLISHEIPKKPWRKVGVDIFHLANRSYILVVDYFSKFIEIAKLQSLQSENVISELKYIFRRHGIPKIIMSDNGPEFSSNLFKEFSLNWKFHHITSSPGYAQSNGQVERSIQTMKNIIKKTNFEGSDLDIALLEYACTPISNNLPSPAELLYNRKLRSIIPHKSNPTVPKIRTQQEYHDRLTQRQGIQKRYFDLRTRNLSPLNIGQKIKLRKFNSWVPGIVHSILGPRSYLISMPN
ncbi:uncharacterized protein K02A2.6-like [Cydia splendana]|uniref:uncharacterized protein K02A2.6-like n=1 Tax=Cydia splendana TaxID=1100963 RepID=UPI00300D914C